MRKSFQMTFSRRQVITRGFLGGASIAAMTAVGVLPAALAQTPPGRKPPAIGVNVGYGLSVSDALVDVEAFEALIGKRVDYIVEHGAQAAWKESVTSALHALRTWRAVSAGSRRGLLWNQPLTMQGTPLAEVADGKHDASFEAIAINIRNSGFYDAIINLGWDMTGAWVPWSASQETKGAYVDAYQRVAAIFKKASPSFKLCWSPHRNQQSVAPEEAYPGDAHVDLVGMSITLIDPPLGPDLVHFVDSTVIGHGAKKIEGKQPYGLAWLAEFAEAHHKPMIIPQVAIGIEAPTHRGAQQSAAFDDDVIVARLAEWIIQHDVALHCWRDVPATEHYALHTRISRSSIITNAKPHVAADERPRMAMAYRKAWGRHVAQSGG